MKQNCWEFQKCGREPGGAKVAELGVCEAAINRVSKGKNSGENGGRYCWAIAGTLCRGKVQGTFAQKIEICTHCSFYKIVKLEEGHRFIFR